MSMDACDPYGNPLRPLTDAERRDPRIQAAASRHDDVHPCSTYEQDLLVARDMLAAADRSRQACPQCGAPVKILPGHEGDERLSYAYEPKIVEKEVC